MRPEKRHGVLWIVLGLSAVIAGCGQGPNSPSELPKANLVGGPPKPPKYDPAAINRPVVSPSGAAVSDRAANPNGVVFVLEYHHLGTSKNTMFRSPEKFRGDLERLYRMGFRPETVTDYLNGSKQIPRGASPAVFTFDDSNPDQVKLNADGSLAKDCFLGIWQDFAASHRDFPIRATFFVLPSMWGQPSMLPQKLALLNRLDCELGNHTITHPILRKLTDEKVKFEIGEAQKRLEKLGVSMPCSLALPFGVSPKNRSLLEGFDYEGEHIAPKAVFLVGANPAPPPGSPKFNRLRIPRIQAYDGEAGIKFWLDEVEKGRVKLYVAG